MNFEVLKDDLFEKHLEVEARFVAVDVRITVQRQDSTLGSLGLMEHVWCIFAITARFDAVVQADLARGILNDSGMTEEAKWFLRAFDRRDIDVVAPPSIDFAGARELAKRIRQLYEQAHGFRAPHGPSLGALIDGWSRDPRRNPRTLIRLIVDELDRIRPLSVT